MHLESESTMKKTFNVTKGAKIRTKGWRQEALLRLLENVLVNGEKPEELIVYASLGKAARDWPSHNQIVNTLKNIEDDETLIIQSGKPIGVLKTHKYAPLVIMANCNVVGQWAKSDLFYKLEKDGLICWGGLTAMDWQYIGSQGVLQGTYEIFCQIAQKYFNDDLTSKFILTAGLGGMGGAQPLAGTLAKAAILIVEANMQKIDKRIATGYLEHKTTSLDEALKLIQNSVKKGKPISVGLHGNASDVYPEILKKGITPDIVSDQTAAHDLIYGYIPSGYTIEEFNKMREQDPKKLESDGLISIKRHVEAMLQFRENGAIVFDNGNNIRTQASKAGCKNPFVIPVFTEAFLRPLFARAIGPFRWVCLSGDKSDLDKIDDWVMKKFPNNKIVTNWIKMAKDIVPIEGLPARIAWLGHLERTQTAVHVNKMVRNGQLKAPVAFTRDHLDAGAMTHPNIMTENMKDGSDAISDWPLLNGMLNCSSMADLVAIHSGGGGYSGYMTSAGVTIIADGTNEAKLRLETSLTNDTALGVLRYADAGYEESLDEIKKKGIRHIKVEK